MTQNGTHAISSGRVVSVSPRSLGPAEPAPDLTNLIAAARREAGRLRAELDEAAAWDIDINETVHRLEERLSVGARMLLAFQQQIDRIEASLETALAAERRNRQMLAALRPPAHPLEPGDAA